VLLWLQRRGLGLDVGQRELASSTSSNPRSSSLQTFYLTVTLSLPNPHSLHCLNLSMFTDFYPTKSHPTLVPLRRMSTRLLRLKRPVSPNSIDLIPTYSPGHSCPQPRIFRLTISGSLYAGVVSTLLAVINQHNPQLIQPQRLPKAPPRPDVKRMIRAPLRRFQLIAWLCKPSFWQEIVEPYPDVGILM
jgi:hypothetical protein